MTSGSMSGDDYDAEVRAFVAGCVRDEIGLKSADLRIGLEVAKNLLKRGAQVEALRTYAGLILCEPANVDFQTGLANCALQIGEHHLALQAASVVVALAPRDPRGYLLSGRACIGIGAYDEAEEDLKDAIVRGREARDAMIVDEAQRLLASMPGRAPQAAATAS